jgi:hypothetical protein
MAIFERLKKLWESNQPKPSLNERDLFGIQPGDIISILDEEYEVLGSIHFNDSGYRWIEYKLRKTHDTYWMSVEEDDEIEVSMYKEVVAITTEPTKQYTYEGVTYYMQEGSDAKVEKVSGKINLSIGTQVDYYEYVNQKGEKFLSIEIWDGEVEMSIGHSIPPYQIEIFPGDLLK